MTFHDPIYSFVDVIEKYQKRDMVVAEIGTSDGSTTKAYIDIIKKNGGHLYAIDWFNGNLGCSSGHHAYDENNSDYVYNLFQENIKSYLDIVTIKRGRSHDMIVELPSQSIDICFIDAGHLYEDVYKDIELILSKMKPDGIICGHDCEDIKLAGKGNDEWLSKDFVGVPSPDMPQEHPHYGLKWVHYGVIQAVYEHFGFDISNVPDPKSGDMTSVWMKMLKPI